MPEKPSRKVKEIVHRKLGKHNAIGLAWEEGKIEIDERLRGEEALYVLVHEIMHIQNPTWGEAKVIGHSKHLSNILFKEGYRKVDLG